MLPELLELVDESVLQLIECRENSIGELPAQMPEDLLGGIEFRTVGWQIEGVHVLWPAPLATAMTARTVQHDPDRTLCQLVAQMLQEDLQACAFHGRQQEKDSCACGGFHCCVEPEPLVLVLHHPGRTFPQWTPAPTQPGDQAKAAFIQGHDPLQRRFLFQATEGFLKAACCSSFAFSCRLRPGFHLTPFLFNSAPRCLPFFLRSPRSLPR